MFHLKIIGAPSFFPVVWGWVKKWFDPITTSKIFILAQQDVLPTLSTFVDIEDIPKKYGGKLDYQFGQLPNLDPKLKKHMSIESKGDAPTFLVASPIRFVDEGEDGDMTALSVGVLDGKQRMEKVAVLHAAPTRVTAQSSNSQSQRTETATLPIRPAAANNQPASLDGIVANGHAATQGGVTSISQAPPQSQPIPNGHVTSPSQPTIVQPALATETSKAQVQAQPISSSAPLEQPLANGGPPESKPQNLSMPPPPTDLERTKTDFFTPPSDAAEAKPLQ